MDRGAFQPAEKNKAPQVRTLDWKVPNYLHVCSHKTWNTVKNHKSNWGDLFLFSIKMWLWINLVQVLEEKDISFVINAQLKQIPFNSFDLYNFSHKNLLKKFILSHCIT